MSKFTPFASFYSDPAVQSKDFCQLRTITFRSTRLKDLLTISVRQHDPFSGWSVMVWVKISLCSRTNFAFVNGTSNCQKQRFTFSPSCKYQASDNGPGFTFLQDNTLLFYLTFLQQQKISVMLWLSQLLVSRTSEMNWTEMSYVDNKIQPLTDLWQVLQEGSNSIAHAVILLTISTRRRIYNLSLMSMVGSGLNLWTFS